MNDFNKLENKFQSIHSDLNKTLPKGMIYHYTNYDGLTNIIKERKLRHTDYRYFNDPTELQYGQNIILQALSNSDIDHHNINQTRKLFISFDKLCHLYIACFSTAIEKLALWRYYASNGTGCAIGFNKNFHETCKDPSVTLGKDAIYNVIYGENESIKIANRFINTYLENKSDSFPLLVTHLISILPSLKDESFKDEHEVRLSCMEGPMLSDPNTSQPFYFKDQYREFIPIQETDIPFVHNIKGNKPIITPGKFCDSDISEIWIGPSCEFIEARGFVRKLLKDNGYNIKNIEIKQPELPFRNS